MESSEQFFDIIQIPYICRQDAFYYENIDHFNIFNEVNIDNIVYKSINTIPIISQSKSLNIIKESLNNIKLRKSNSM